MKIYNLFTGSGFDMSFGGNFSFAVGGLAILAFMCIFGKAWLRDRFMVIPWNGLGGWVGAIIPYLIVITFTGSARWSMVAGIIGMFVLAIYGDSLWGETW
jgi:hypothetical protein